MGKFLFLEDFKNNSDKFSPYDDSIRLFVKEFWNVENAIPKEYPGRLHIHDRANVDWVTIRRFIERKLEGDVIVTWLSKNHRVRRGNSWSSIKCHGYHVLNFEIDYEAALFSLSFTDVVSEVLEYHPSCDPNDCRPLG